MALNQTTLTNAISSALFTSLGQLPVSIPPSGSATTLSSTLSGAPGVGITGTQMLQNFCDHVASAVSSAVISQLKATADITITVANHTHSGGTLVGGLTGAPIVGPTAVEYGKPGDVPSTGGIS